LRYVVVGAACTTDTADDDQDTPFKHPDMNGRYCWKPPPPA